MELLNSFMIHAFDTCFMFESFVLGTIQGIAEWLPVSSEGMIFLVKSNFFSSDEGILEIARLALFLHFGTFLAALVFFRKEVFSLIKDLFLWNKISKSKKSILLFFIISTLISGVLGLILLKVADNFGSKIEDYGKYITFFVGILLLITAWLQIKAKKGGVKTEYDLKTKDGILLGIAQGFAALPGLSRSGLTVASLMIRKFNPETAIKLSFLMSLPIVLAGNIILNLDSFKPNANNMVGLLASFIFGLITIKFLLKFAKKINFGWFIFGFAVLTILSALI
jgi:undecaprenyl-diphosphatase